MAASGPPAAIGVVKAEAPSYLLGFRGCAVPFDEERTLGGSRANTSCCHQRQPGGSWLANRKEALRPCGKMREAEESEGGKGHKALG